MKRFILPLGFIVVLAALWYMWSGSGSGAGNGAMGGPGGPGQMTPEVAVITIGQEEIVQSITLPGRISPFRQSQVRPQVDGIITERLFEEGATVEKGQQLYQIDDARFKAATGSALADLKSARANVKTIEARTKRYEQLVKINAVSKQEYDDVKAQLDQANAAIAVAQAAVDVANVNMGYTKVYAPISGRIGKSFVTEGALVTANQSQSLTVITQLDPVYIDMQQSGDEAVKLRTQMAGKDSVPVHVQLDEKTNLLYAHEGTLKFSEVTVDETTGSIALRAIMPNPDGQLLPGLFVRASVDLGSEKAILVPQRATVRTPDGKLVVWTVSADQKAHMTSIDVIKTYKDQWIVQSGLSVGDTVIIEGYQKIAEGALVKTTPWVNPNVAPTPEEKAPPAPTSDAASAPAAKPLTEETVQTTDTPLSEEPAVINAAPPAPKPVAEKMEPSSAMSTPETDTSASAAAPLETNTPADEKNTDSPVDTSSTTTTKAQDPAPKKQ
jgi:membrane fusion protein (multidrug efflux system)